MSSALQTVCKLLPLLLVQFIIVACGDSDSSNLISGHSKTDDSKAENDSGSIKDDGSSPAQLKLTSQNDKSNGYIPFIEIDYKNSDFTKVIRCRSTYELRSPVGKLIRHSSGVIQSESAVERKAVWETALSATESCQLIGEKTVRAAFNDMLAASGKYFYLFNPCRESSDPLTGGVRTKCSFDLISSVNVNLHNSHMAQGTRLARQLAEKESQLTGLALRIREQMLQSLQKQKACENNEAVDAVKEARQKALSAILVSGIAASIGGLVGGSQGAAIAAQKTLQWIYENFSANSGDNTGNCKILSELDAAAKESAAAIDILSKEIDQLKAELVSLYK
jgi:hypothetical protein